MHKIKEKLMEELYEYEEKAKKMSGGKISAGDLEALHKLTDTIKNIDKIEMYEEIDEEMGGSSYARRGGRGRGRNARRDSMGRYAREGGSSYEGGYSEEGGSYRRGGSSYEGGQGGMMGGNMGGNMGGGSSYARGRGRGRSSYAGGGYSYGGAKDYMIDKMEEMMDMAESEQERRAIQRCIQEIENQ